MRLERLLDERGKTKADLARNCSISQNGISTWKVTGAPPRADVACRIARFLGVSVEYLIEGEIPDLGREGNDLAYEVSRLSAKKKELVGAFIEALEKLD